MKRLLNTVIVSVWLLNSTPSWGITFITSFKLGEKYDKVFN